MSVIWFIYYIYRVDFYKSDLNVGLTMPIEIEGQLYYSTTETCKKMGISRATLYRWLQKGLINRLRKDRRGWRLFTESDLHRIQAEIGRIEIEER